MLKLQTLVKGLMTLTLALGLVSAARAEMNIEFSVDGSAGRYAIAIVPFKDEAAQRTAPTPVVRNDLALSGEFRLVDGSAVSNVPFDAPQIDYAKWLAAGAQAIAVGKVVATADGQATISFRLMDVARKKELTSGQFTVPQERVREVGHTIADMIYQAILGQPGIFNTRIAYVLKQGRGYQLQVANVDGSNLQTILRSREPIMSPSWSPNGRYLAYVSFETHKPVVWVQDLATGSRRAVANFKGSNSAPAWSPDGNRLAVVLTTSGNSQIYLVPAAGGSPRRLTYSDGIDTEPVWAPDGATILFVSDRSGGPQVYSVGIDGGSPRRLTWQGSYNVSPRVSPDGKSFTYIRKSGGEFRVVVQDIAGGDSRVLSTGYNERPSFAPNGRMVLYASVVGGKSVLYAATQDGGSKVKLAVINGDVQDPAWGPFNNP
jgi:TolB protein